MSFRENRLMTISCLATAEPFDSAFYRLLTDSEEEARFDKSQGDGHASIIPRVVSGSWLHSSGSDVLHGIYRRTVARPILA